MKEEEFLKDCVPDPKKAEAAHVKPNDGGDGTYAFACDVEALDASRDQKLAMIRAKEDELLGRMLGDDDPDPKTILAVARLRMLVDSQSPNAKDRAKAREQLLDSYGLLEQKVRVTSTDEYQNVLTDLFGDGRN